PFTDKGKVDTQAARKIANYLVEDGTTPFLQGTTGEGLSISNEERLNLTKAVVDECSGSSLVIAAISHHAFGDSVMLGRRFLELGVDAVAAHLPTFYPMSDNQIIQYFKKLADAVEGPLIIYNIPQTVGRSIPLEVADQLSHHPNICGIKDSENDLPRQETEINWWSERNDFAHMIGWAAQSAHAVSKGSDGIVPSCGNIVPHLYRELYEAASEGDMKQAKKLQKNTDAIGRIYQEGRSLTDSLAALKVIMKHFDFCETHIQPPLTGCSDEEVQTIKSRIST